MTSKTPQEWISTLELGAMVLIPSPFDLDDKESLELTVTHVSEQGAREFDVHYHGVRLRKMAAQVTPEGKILWVTV